MQIQGGGISCVVPSMPLHPKYKLLVCLHSYSSEEGHRSFNWVDDIVKGKADSKEVGSTESLEPFVRTKKIPYSLMEGT